MNKNFVVLLIMLALFSCKQNEVVKTDDSGHIDAIVNGIEWKSADFDNPYINIDRSGGIASMNLVWKLPTWTTEANSGNKMYISMYYPITTGKYYFNNNIHSLPSKGVGVFIQGWEKNGSKIDYYSTSGYIEIISMNSVYVEGNFSFTAKDDSNNSLKMTNGVFKANIVAYEN